MIKAVPFINTHGTDKYKDILNQKFDIRMLYSLSENDEIKVLFVGWRGKNVGNWYKFSNDDGVVLEFYPEYYTISKVTGNVKYQLKTPETINDFINTMNRYGVQVYWGDWIDDVAEPKDYMEKSEIEEYYRTLLIKIGKSHELS